MPYQLRDDFLSDSEASFFLVLLSMVEGHFMVFPKVRLADIFSVSQPNGDFGYFNKISAKHVDFLVCDSRDLRPAFAVELDGSSHEKARRVERDLFVDEVFDTAGLPLIRVPVRGNYDTRELGDLFRQALRPSGSLRQAEPVPDNQIDQDPAESAVRSGGPLCPKCGIPMVVRTTRRGPRVGERFYGCTNYPKCWRVLPYEQPETAPV